MPHTTKHVHRKYSSEVADVTIFTSGGELHTVKIEDAATGENKLTSYNSRHARRQAEQLAERAVQWTEAELTEFIRRPK